MTQISTPTEPDGAVPPNEVDEAPPSDASPAVSDEAATDAVAPDEAPPSAGEGGEASPGIVGHYDAEIIIGEIPDTADLSVMRWTARCALEAHGLLGHYDSRDEAESAGNEHLASLHAAA